MRRKLLWLVSVSAFLPLAEAIGFASVQRAIALSDSVGDRGINATTLHGQPYNLIGRKIALGQVEIGRPAKFGFDKKAAWNPPLKLAGIFYRDRPAKVNSHLDSHAAQVATVMISQDKRLPGVAPGAKLYSAAVGSLRGGGQTEECLAAQHIAQQNSGDVRAINFSFGESLSQDPRENPKLDGNALLTQCVDWSARVHDVLYVVAGNQGEGGIPIPTDNYNGITTAYTAQREGAFLKVDFANLSGFPAGIGRTLIEQEINQGERRAVSLIAPGHQIAVYGLEGEITQVSGTSFAAPHITGTVALLQEWGDRALRQNRPNWSLDYRQHQVIKAILLNSADKIADTGDGLLLGMERTVLGKRNYTWLNSDAYYEPETPLDIEMGTGHLNAFRAYQQLDGGQWQPGEVGARGWNYDQIELEDRVEYELQQPLEAGSYVAITLAWDRLVELNDSNQNQRYDLGETFSDRGLNNLDLYLVPEDENQPLSRCSSTSEVDSVEHIFCQIPQAGKYKIQVHFHNSVHQSEQAYAIAWWTVPVKQPNLKP